MTLNTVESRAMNFPSSSSGSIARADGHAFLVVARGQSSLLAEVRQVVAALDWVDVIEDRRQKPSLLPRQGLSSR
jgi:hypothetical protein